MLAISGMVDQAPRKIPMAIWVGTDDPLFPVAAVRQTRGALNAAGFDTKLTEIKGHTHNYYGRSDSINKEVWAKVPPADQRLVELVAKLVTFETWVKVTLTDGGPSEFEMRFGDSGSAHAPNAPTATKP